MRKIFSGIVVLLMIQTVQAQEVIRLEEFNKYKYVSVETMIDKRRDRVDPWGISTYLRYKLIKFGLNVLDDRKKDWPEDAKFNECLVVNCDITDNTKKLGRNRIELLFTNCHGDTLYYDRGSGYEDTERESYNAAIDRALEPMEEITYAFDESQTLDPILPEVETSEDDESELMAYLDAEERHSVEGIYSFTGEYTYRIGIRKKDEGFEGAILSSDAEYWKTFEVKIYLEPSMLGEDVFNITWLDDTKSKSETVGKLIEGDLIMEIKTEDQRRTIKLVKEYPKKEN